MNDLDKRIAELKGWIITQDKYLGTRFNYGTPVGELSIDAYSWAESDAKAFELVDEISAPVVFELKRSRLPDTWYAWFSFADHNSVGYGATRPEAICKAYIAAREYLEKRKEGEG